MLSDVLGADTSRRGVAAYRFDIVLDGARVGSLSLRPDVAANVLLYAGHVGFGIDEPHRGRRLAERATRLMLPFARALGLSSLWLTCEPANAASRRTIERLGAQFVEEVPIPPDYEAYARGERVKRRYRLDLA